MNRALATQERTRTHAVVSVHGDPWPLVAAWAQRHRFLPRQPQTPTTKLFQKGSGFWTAPMKTQFILDGDALHLQAWVHVPLFSRIMALFLLPREMPIASGGLRGAVPRKMARTAVNELLVQLGGQPID